MTQKTGIEERLLQLKAETGWSWERMAQEFMRTQGGLKGVTGTTLFRYAKGASKPRNKMLKQYVVNALDKLVATERAQHESEAQHQRAEEALRRTEVHYRILYHNSPIMMHSIDRSGRLISVSDHWLEKLGYAWDEVIGRKSVEFLAEESRRRAEEVILPDFFHKGYCKDVKYQFVKKNGEILDVLLSATAVRDPQGEIDYSLAVLLDVTESQRKEEKLHRQNAYLEALHETTLDLMSRRELRDLLRAIVSRAGALVGTSHGYIYLIDPSGTGMEVQVATGAFTQDVGYKIKRSVGLAGRVWHTGQPLAVEDYSAWPGRVSDPRFDKLRAVAAVPLTSGSQVVGVIALTYLEGGLTFGKDEMDILSRFAALASIALDHARMDLAMQKELHERSQAEELLRESEEKWRSLVKHAPDIIVIADRDGTISFINHTVEGIAVEEAIGTSVYDYVPPEHHKIMRQSIERVFQTGETAELEVEGLGPHLTISWYRSRMGPIKRDGRVVQVMIITTDVTASKQEGRNDRMVGIGQRELGQGRV